MSIWTSKIRAAAAAVAACLLISACVTEGGGRSTAPPAVPGGVALAAPSGFCLVESTRQIRGEADLAAFRRCAGGTEQDAILTVAVGGADSARGLRFEAGEMTAFFTSDAGRRALSRSNNARSVTVHEVRRAPDATLLRVTDRAQPGGVNGWRAVTGLRDRLVTLAVRNPEDGSTLDPAEAERLIARFLAAMKGANR
ncbi:MAG: cation transport ATPase [Pseudorhodobacter sp.]